jgi:hypothetical protein
MNKRTILAIIVIIMPSLLLAQSVTYTLNVKVAQLDSTAKAYLIYSNAAGNQKDSALMRNGLFVFAGAVDQPVNAYLTINNKGTGTSTKALIYTLKREQFLLSVWIPLSTRKLVADR